MSPLVLFPVWGMTPRGDFTKTYFWVWEHLASDIGVCIPTHTGGQSDAAEEEYVGVHETSMAC
jgi:hypothetical protein